MNSYLIAMLAGIAVGIITGCSWQKMIASRIWMISTFVLTVMFLFFVAGELTRGGNNLDKGLHLCVEWGATFAVTWLADRMKILDGLP